MGYAIKIYLLLCLSILLPHCSSSETVDVNTAQGAYRQAQIYEDDERFEEAITAYQNVKNRFPYSAFVKNSELSIAEIYFKREDFLEAQHAYQLYKDLHPKDKIIDQITYKLALSIFSQLPSTIDRDLSLAHEAILFFDEVIESYPQSQYVIKSKKMRLDSYKKLTKKEYYIAQYYFGQKEFLSALGRYEVIINKYSSFGYETQALKGAIVSAFEVKQKNRAQRHYSKLVKIHPDSSEAKYIKRKYKNELR
jgi:outer membrane protein assembly factor BamD